MSLIRHIFLILIMTLVVGASSAAQQHQAKIAIIIDDIGNNRGDLEAALIPGKLTFAVLPFTPHARSFALRAHHQNKQIMLHAPMQAMRGNRLGPGGLTTEMSAAAIKLELQRALNHIPYVVGVNNHMGSYFTQAEGPMRAVMETLHYQRLFFIDSRTSEYSVAEQLATEIGVPTNHRHVFLDNEVTDDYLLHQWQQLIQHALKHGGAVAIGHPYPETLAFLRQKIPKLKTLGIELVFASDIAELRPQPLSGQMLQTSQ